MSHWCMPRACKVARSGKILYTVCAYYAGTQFGFKWYISTHVEDVCDTLVKMFEYSLMWEYSVVQLFTIIMNNTTVGRYVKLDSLPFLSLYNTHNYLTDIHKNVIPSKTHKQAIPCQFFIMMQFHQMNMTPLHHRIYIQYHAPLTNLVVPVMYLDHCKDHHILLTPIHHRNNMA